MDRLREMALGMAKKREPTATSITAVAGLTSPEASRWAFQQWTLRERAKAKFDAASEMLFDRDGLEMASHERLAAYHASHYPPGVRVLDLCCGLGSDLIALARRGPAIGFELDVDRAEFARHNVSIHGLGAEVLELDALTATGPYAFADPSRRRGGSRTLDPGEFSPNPRDLARNFANAKLFGMKLSPLLRDSYFEDIGREGRVEFMSFGGECREALVWLGSEVGVKGRFAVHIESSEKLGIEAVPLAASTADKWVFEADPAAIRAHALGNFGLLSLGDTPGYLTGANRVQSPWLKAYRVLSTLRGDLKEVQRALIEYGAAVPEVKQRGPQLDPAAIRKRLKAGGTLACVLIAYSLGKSVRFILAEPAAND